MAENNTYNYNVNYFGPENIIGVMIINDPDGNNDILNLNELTASDVVCAADGNDLIIRMSDPSKFVKIIGWFDGTDAHMIEHMYFRNASGTVTGQLAVGTNIADEIMLGDGKDKAKGGQGNDLLFGGGGDDELNGEKGDDTLQGGLDNDTYVIDHKVGNDQDTNNDIIFDTFDPLVTPVDAGVNDRVKFDLSLANVTFSKAGDNLLANLSTGETLTIQNHFKDYGYNQYYNRIENFEFEGGVVKSYAEIEINISGTTGNDIITGTGWKDIIDGKAGNDTIYGYSGVDQLIGGTGDDRLEGGAGNDIYKYQAGDGKDVLFDHYSP